MGVGAEEGVPHVGIAVRRGVEHPEEGAGVDREEGAEGRGGGDAGG